MNDLVEKIRAALDEDERIVETMRSGGYEPDIWEIEPSDTPGWSHIVSKSRLLGDPGEAAVSEDPEPVAIAQLGRWEDKHIARHDPARVLRQVAAMRKILELHTPFIADEEDPDPICQACLEGDHLYGESAYPCPTLLMLAEAYGIEP